jgi:hypothetical protein
MPSVRRGNEGGCAVSVKRRANSFSREHFHRPVYQFDGKNIAFLQFVENNLGSEKTQSQKKQGVISNPLVFLDLSEKPATIFEDQQHHRAPSFSVCKVNWLACLLSLVKTRCWKSTRESRILRSFDQTSQTATLFRRYIYPKF